MFECENKNLGQGNYGLFLYTKVGGGMKFIEKVSKFNFETDLCRELREVQCKGKGDFSIFPLIIGVSGDCIYQEFLEGASSIKLRPSVGSWDGDQEICDLIANAVVKLNGMSFLSNIPSPPSLDAIFKKLSISLYGKSNDFFKIYQSDFERFDRAFFQVFESGDVVFQHNDMKPDNLCYVDDVGGVKFIDLAGLGYNPIGACFRSYYRMVLAEQVCSFFYSKILTSYSSACGVAFSKIRFASSYAALFTLLSETAKNKDVSKFKRNLALIDLCVSDLREQCEAFNF